MWKVSLSVHTVCSYVEILNIKTFISNLSAMEVITTYHMDIQEDEYVTAKIDVTGLNDLNFHIGLVKWSEIN